MTATLPRPTKSGQRPRRDPEKNYVECPVCGIPTGTFESAGCRSTMLPAASGYEDGARCKAHARSLELREEQSREGLRIALWRQARGGGCVVDDMCQGTE